MKADSRNGCASCKHKSEIPGTRFVTCTNYKASVIGEDYGIQNGLFDWPHFFDPVWLVACTGHEPSNDKNKSDNSGNEGVGIQGED